MDTLIIYYSKFGNTYKIAETITASLPGNGNKSVINFGQLTVNLLEEADLLVMGSPTHNMGLPKSLNPIFHNLPGGILYGKQVATFDTSYKMSWLLNQFTASKRLARNLRKLGGKLVVHPEIFHVVEREGPLHSGELERAQEWATTIHEKINKQEAFNRC